jgi:hypothetical protein
LIGRIREAPEHTRSGLLTEENVMAEKASTVVPFVIRAERSGVAQKIVAAGSAGHPFRADQGVDGNANFGKVTVSAQVETSADEAQFARLVSETERRCPVTQLFRRSGLAFENHWTRIALPVARAS